MRFLWDLKRGGGHSAEKRGCGVEDEQWGGVGVLTASFDPGFDLLTWVILKRIWALWVG